MTKYQKVFLMVLGFVLLLGSSVMAGTGQPLPSIKEVIVYTDGLVYLERQGEVNFDNGEYVADSLPSVLRGSLRVFTLDPQVRIENVTAFQEEIATEAPLKGIGDFFQANIGSSIQLATENRLIDCAIKGFINPNLIVVTVNKEDGAIADELYPVDQVTAFYLKEPAKMSKKEMKPGAKLRVKIGGEAISGRYPFGLSYMQTGISWYPEYILDLQSESLGELVFSAVIQNDLEDLEDCVFYLAEEGPSFDRTLSPLALFQTVREEALFARDVAGRGVYKEMELSSVPGTMQEKLTSMKMYKKSGVNLKKGERTIFPLFKGGVRVEPIYRLDLSRNNYLSQISQSPVWKGYRVYNDSTTTHWVEGQVMITYGAKPLAQKILPFIAPQSSGEIKVLAENEIRAQVTEEEFERIQSVLTFGSTEYSSVQVRGEIELVNLKNEDATLKVVYLLPGEVTQVSHSAKLTKTAAALYGPNPQTEAVWEVKLPAGGVTVLSYAYQVYVPLGASIR